MRKLCATALAVVAFVVPRIASGQTITTPYAGTSQTSFTGTLTTITTDAVSTPLLGSQWATARFRATIAGTATATAQVQVNGQWIAAPYATRISTVAANPTVQPIAATLLTAGDIWEVPLPGNATGFQLLCGATGTATTVQVSGGLPYVPGMPVNAVLSDVAEAGIGAGIGSATTVLEVGGWNAVTVTGVSPTGASVTVRQLDDAGTAFAGTTVTMTAASSGALTLARGAGNTAINTVSASAFAAIGLVAKRIAAYLPAAGTISTGRIRIEASR